MPIGMYYGRKYRVIVSNGNVKYDFTIESKQHACCLHKIKSK